MQLTTIEKFQQNYWHDNRQILASKQNNTLCEKLLRNDNSGVGDCHMPGTEGAETH